MMKHLKRREKVSVMKHDGEKKKHNHAYSEYWDDPDLVILVNISGERKKTDTERDGVEKT